MGGGNAGLVAALSARASAERVLILERAPRHMRGGNTRHTRNIRCAHDAGDAFTPGSYRADELLADLNSVGDGPVDPKLAELAVNGSRTVPAWMEAHGVKWQRPLRGTLGLARTNRFFLGGGTALVNTYYHAAEAMGIATAYDASVIDLELEAGVIRAIVVATTQGNLAVRSRAFVVASGGFEANIDWLKRYWGSSAENYVIRGTPYNDGILLARLLDLGARTAGDSKGFHAIGVDARSPKYDGGIATRVDSIPLSIVVNREAERFSDEAADVWPKRYASWGRLIAEQPGQLAYSIFDSRVKGLFIPSLYEPLTGATIKELAARLELDPERLDRTVCSYNASVTTTAAFDPQVKDGRSTIGLAPPKSNWALPISEPPFYAFPLRPGVTFTYLGLAVDERARVLGDGAVSFENLYAAGEVMSGNILSSGYLAGFGLTIGHTFGRIAGREAASART